MANSWVLYGATGYTGTLLAAEAAKRGHRPLLSGRNAEKLRALAEPLGLEWKAVAIDDAAGLRALLDGKQVVLHAAGPFVDTSEAMVAACLATGCSYLDITGELSVFEAIFARDGEAKARHVALIPGVGFDVVPTDCLAAYVAAKLPNAQTLEIALAALSRPSSGTLKSVVGLLPTGGKVRRNGALVSQPLGKGVHRVRFSSRQRWVVPAPIADLVTGWHTTRIPEITVSVAISSGQARTLKVGWPLAAVGQPVLRGLLGVSSLRARVDRAIEKRIHGPDEAGRLRGRSYIYAKVTAGAESAEAWLEAAEGYQFTLHAAVSAVEVVLAKKPEGALTPSQALGTDFVLGVPGTRRFDRLEEGPQR